MEGQFGKFAKGHAPGFGDGGGRITDEGGFICAAPVGHGREIWGVGFDHDPVVGDIGGDFQKLQAVFKGHDSCKGDMIAQIDDLIGHLAAARKAVDHGPLNADLFEDSNRIFFGFAGVDDDRFIDLFCELQEAAKDLLLHVFRRIIVEIIQADFADSDDFGEGSEVVFDGREDLFCAFCRVMGVDSGGAADLLIFSRKLKSPVVALEIAAGADGDDAFNAGVLGTG